jgi:hypothetical protein
MGNQNNEKILLVLLAVIGAIIVVSVLLIWLMPGMMMGEGGMMGRGLMNCCGGMAGLWGVGASFGGSDSRCHRFVTSSAATSLETMRERMDRKSWRYTVLSPEAEI